MLKQTLQNVGVRKIVAIVLAVVVISGISFYAGNNEGSSNAASRNSGGTPKSIYLDPGSGNVTAGSVVSTTIYEDSATKPVNVVQVALTYPTDKFEFMSLAEGSTFTNIASTDTSTPGLIRLARALPTGTTTGISGAQKVAVVNFRVLPAASGTATLDFDTNSTFLVSSADNSNILGAVGGASYRVHK